MERIHLAAVLSSLHLLALAIGLPSVFLRGRSLRGTLDAAGLNRLFVADSFWGLAALLWISTGLIRAFGGMEKGTDFYLESSLFWVKMSLLGAVLLLEIWPMSTFIRWRVQRGRGVEPDTSVAERLAVVNWLQVGIVVLMVFVASLMARGVGFGL